MRKPQENSESDERIRKIESHPQFEHEFSMEDRMTEPTMWHPVWPGHGSRSDSFWGNEGELMNPAQVPKFEIAIGSADQAVLQCRAVGSSAHRHDDGA